MAELNKKLDEMGNLKQLDSRLTTAEEWRTEANTVIGEMTEKMGR